MYKYEHIEFNTWQELCKYLIDNSCLLYCRKNEQEIFNIAYHKNKNAFVDKYGMSHVGQIDKEILIANIDKEQLLNNFYRYVKCTIEDLIKERPRLCKIWKDVIRDDNYKLQIIYGVSEEGTISLDGVNYYTNNGNIKNVELVNDDDVKKFFNLS